MTRRKCILLFCVGLGISWLVTGGCVGFESGYRVVDSYNKNYRPLIMVKVSSNHHTHGIRFLLEYIDNTPPYDAHFSYDTQDIVKGADLRIARLAIQYSDGTQTDLTAQVPAILATEPDEMWYIEDHVQVKKPCLRVQWTIPGCVSQKGRFTMIFSGTLRKGDRVLESFDTSLRCDPSGGWHYFTRWYWWVVSQA